MANDDKKPTAAEKGKGKVNELDSKDKTTKFEETKKDKDGKPVVNGKEDDAPQEGQQQITAGCWVSTANNNIQRSSARKTNS